MIGHVQFYDARPHQDGHVDIVITSGAPPMQTWYSASYTPTRYTAPYLPCTVIPAPGEGRRMPSQVGTCMQCDSHGYLYFKSAKSICGCISGQASGRLSVTQTLAIGL
jgi:hypothetical protein